MTWGEFVRRVESMMKSQGVINPDNEKIADLNVYHPESPANIAVDRDIDLDQDGWVIMNGAN